MESDAGGGTPQVRRVLIAGGGIAAAEAALALRDLARDRVEIELLAPTRHLTYGLIPIADAIGLRRPPRFDLEAITRGAGVTHRRDALAAVEPERRVVRTRKGATLGYDSLIVATGATPQAAVPGALNYRGVEDARAIRALLRSIDAGTVHSVVFAVPPRSGWPLPAYELALLTASRIPRDSGRGPELTVATHERVPLSQFGARASARISVLMHESSVRLCVGARPLEVDEGGLRVVPGRRLEADRTVALAVEEGPSLPGIPSDGHGFVPTDAQGQVSGARHVYAAGDVTAFPVKHGLLAADQAYAVATAIAAEAGAPVKPLPFRPALHDLLLGGRLDRIPGRYLGARVAPPRPAAPTAEPRRDVAARSGRFRLPAREGEGLEHPTSA